MAGRTTTRTRGAKTDKVMARQGDGHPNAPVSRREFKQLIALVSELEGVVVQTRKDLDVQFQRLAQLQAVIDRIQVAAHGRRRKRESRNE